MVVFDGVLAGPVLVTDRSAVVATVVVVVELLLPGLRSAVDEVMVAVLLMVEPLAADGETRAVIVNNPTAPTGNEAMLQIAVAPVVQVKVGPEICVSDTNVVPAGSTSDQLTLAASEGPLLPTVML